MSGLGISLFALLLPLLFRSCRSLQKEWRKQITPITLYERVILSFEVWLASNLFFSPSFSHFYAQKKEQIAVKDDIHQWLVYNYALYKNTTILSKFYFKKSVNFFDGCDNDWKSPGQLPTPWSCCSPAPNLFLVSEI